MDILSVWGILADSRHSDFSEISSNTAKRKSHFRNSKFQGFSRVVYSREVKLICPLKEKKIDDVC